MKTRIHTRTIVCDAYESPGGLIDIEATLRDVKSSSVNVPGRGLVEAGEPIHELTLSMTIDGNKEIRNTAVKVAHAPFASCGEVATSYRGLVGMTIGSGFRRQVREMFGSTAGCTHLTELLPVMATVAYQVARDRQRESGEESNAKDAYFYIDSCHSLRADGNNVRDHFPRFFKPGSPNDSDPKEERNDGRRRLPKTAS